MINTIKITKYIRSFLIANQQLTQLVPAKNIFPIVALQNTKFPFITMQKTGLIARYTKDFHEEDVITYEVITVSDDYSKSIDIATLIRDTLECKHYQSEEITIYSIKLESVQEEYAEGAYIQRLAFVINAA